MPWCEACAKFWSPASTTDGTCPTCGAELAGPQPTQTKAVPKAPWHFKLLLVALVIYLGYRAYQGVWWVGHTWLHIF